MLSPVFAKGIKSIIFYFIEIQELYGAVLIAII